MPEPLVVTEPVVSLAQRLGIQPVEALPSRLPLTDKSSLAQHAKMLRDGGLGHFEAVYERRHGLFLPGQQIEQRPAGGIGDGAKDVGLFHERELYLRKCLLVKRNIGHSRMP